MLNVEAAFHLLEKPWARLRRASSRGVSACPRSKEVPSAVAAEYRALEEDEWSYQERRDQLTNSGGLVRYNEDL